MEDLFDRILDRTRSRLDIPTLRTLFGLKNRPHSNRAAGPPAQEAVIEKPQYGLAWFRIRFGLLQLKAYTKGEHVLRFEATVHNTRELRCRRGLENFPEIIGRLAGMAERFCTTVDCVDISFLKDRALDELPLPSRIGVTRTGGIDLNKPRIRPPCPRHWPWPPRHTASLSPSSPPRPARAGRPATPSGRALTTCASSAARASPSSPAGRAATTSRLTRQCTGPSPAPPASSPSAASRPAAAGKKSGSSRATGPERPDPASDNGTHSDHPGQRGLPASHLHSCPTPTVSWVHD